MTDSRVLEKLAIDGGPKLRQVPYPTRGLFGPEEKQAAVAVFDKCIEDGTPIVYNGPEEKAYCEEFADYLGGGYADGVNSGTTAVWVALRALELEPFSEVIVPPISDPGGIMPVALCNCIPVPADSMPDSYNTGPEQIAEKLTDRTSAIVIAHIAGIPVDMNPIMKLARSRGIPVIEDCAQAHGATYDGKMVGTFGDVAAFSTMSGKHHATGGQGGIVFTKDEELYYSAMRHGDRGKPHGIENPEGNVVAALNCNMDELHAAIGRVQLRKLPQCVEKRRKIAAAIEAGCRERLKAARLVFDPPNGTNACWFLFLHLELDLLKVGRDQFAKALAEEGIAAGQNYWHVPTQMPWHHNRRVFGKNSELPWSQAAQCNEYPKSWPLPNIEAADAQHMLLFVHEGMGDTEVQDTLAALEKLERAYLK